MTNLNNLLVVALALLSSFAIITRAFERSDEIASEMQTTSLKLDTDLGAKGPLTWIETIKKILKSKRNQPQRVVNRRTLAEHLWPRNGSMYGKRSVGLPLIEEDDGMSPGNQVYERQSHMRRVSNSQKFELFSRSILDFCSLKIRGK